MTNKKLKFMVQGALIAALYAALTYAASLVGLAYGNIQFRFSEALTVLAAFTPAAIPGLTIGCFLGNLNSPFGMVDVVCGTLATLTAAFMTYGMRNIKVKGLPILAPLPPVIMNALIVGAEIAFFMPEGFSWMGFLIAALEVGVGELVVCFALGLPLASVFNKTGLDKQMK